MTLVHKFDMDMVTVHLHTQNEAHMVQNYSLNRQIHKHPDSTGIVYFVYATGDHAVILVERGLVGEKGDER